jgi:hypothetical protein
MVVAHQQDARIPLKTLRLRTVEMFDRRSFHGHPRALVSVSPLPGLCFMTRLHAFNREQLLASARGELFGTAAGRFA